MRKLFSVLLVVTMLLTITGTALAEKPGNFDSKGNATEWLYDPGFNEWGYNYGAHMFSGGYCESYRNAAWCFPYAEVDLIMKWNDAWLSNMDRGTDGTTGGLPDGKLDRYYGFDSYIGSGAWLTNHQKGVNDDGTVWTYFTKIIAAPADAYLTAGCGTQLTEPESDRLSGVRSRLSRKSTMIPRSERTAYSMSVLTMPASAAGRSPSPATSLTFHLLPSLSTKPCKY